MACVSSNFDVAVNCSGYIGGGDTLFLYWNINNCPAAYAQAINTDPNTLLAYNPNCQNEVQDLVVNLFNTYLSTNTITDNVTDPNFNTFQYQLLNLCTDPTLPGVCGKFLGGPSGYCSTFTRDEVTNSPILTDFCGCYTPPDPTYLQITNNPACDPLCHRSLTSQKAIDETGSIISCEQNICVIDNVVVNVANSAIANGINFTTVCPGCGGGTGATGCLCVVSGVNISSTLSSIGVGANINQFCGPNSVCIVQDDEGNVISSGACENINPANVGIPTFPHYPVPGIVFIMLLIVLLVLFTVIALRIGGKQSVTVKAPTVLVELPPSGTNPTYKIP